MKALENADCGICLNVRQLLFLIRTRFAKESFQFAAQVLSATNEFYIGTTMGFHIAQSTKVATIQKGDFRLVSIKVSAHIFGNFIRSSAF